MENHDNARIGSLTTDSALLQNTAALTVFSGGIPLAYYGQEQILTSKGDPNNREALWLTGYKTSGNLYPYFAQLNAIRALAIKKDGQYLKAAPAYAMPATNVLSITKGSMLVLISNAGSNGKTVSFNLGGVTAGTAMVEAISCVQATASRTGKLAVNVVKGAPQAWLPKNTLTGSGICKL
jgi:alpha-amylase